MSWARMTCAGRSSSSPLATAATRGGPRRGHEPLSRVAPMKLLLTNDQCPGDVLMLTAAVRDLHRAHPGRFVTAVRTNHPELWENNPHVVPPEALGTPDRVIACGYPLVHESNRRPYHFIHGFAQDLESKL